MANPYEIGPAAKGVGGLLSSIMNGGAVQEAARTKQQMALYQMQDAQAGLDAKMTKALKDRDERSALNRMQSNYVAAGVDPILAAIGGDAGIAGLGNISQVNEVMTRRAALASAQADPNFTPMNAQLASLANAPIANVKIEGNNELTGMYGNKPGVTATELGRAMIGTQGSQQTANYARAGASNAQANLSNVKAAGGGFAPRANSGGGAVGKTEKYSDPKAYERNNAFVHIDKDGNKVTDVADEAQFNAWRLKNDIPNGSQALDLYHQYKGQPYIHPSAQARVISGGVVVPAGQDPDLVGELLNMAMDAQNEGHPLTREQLGQMAVQKATTGAISLDAPRPGEHHASTIGHALSATLAAAQAPSDKRAGNQPIMLQPVNATQAHAEAASPRTQSAPQAPREASARRAGTAYQTPKGLLLWTGTGWRRP